MAKVYNSLGQIGMTPGGTMDQDNIDIFKYVNVNRPSSQVVAIAANNLPSYVVDEKTSVWIIANVYEPYNIESDQERPQLLRRVVYKVINTGKGTYGQGGIQLDEGIHLGYVSQTELTLQSVISDPNTQIIECGDISPYSIDNWLNIQTPAISLQSQSVGYRVFRTDDVNYLFLGDAGLYGLGSMQSVISDFEPLADDIESDDQNNIFIFYTVRKRLLEYNIQDVLEAINSMSPYVVDKIENIGYRALIYYPEGPKTYKYILTKSGKGQYGLNQPIQLNSSNIELVYEEVSTSSELLEGETQYINLGEIGNAIVDEYINTFWGEITIQNVNAGPVVINTYNEGVPVNYLYTGPDGMFGENFEQVLPNYFYPFNIDGEVIIPETDGMYIPLAGTAEDDPVTGAIELQHNTASLYTGEGRDLSLELKSGLFGGRLLLARLGEGEVLSGVLIEDGIALFNNNNFLKSNEDKTALVVGALVGGIGLSIRGLTGAADYTANITDLDYTQKKYVDDAIDAISGGGIINAITGEQGVTIADDGTGGKVVGLGDINPNTISVSGGAFSVSSAGVLAANVGATVNNTLTVNGTLSAGQATITGTMTSGSVQSDAIVSTGNLNGNSITSSTNIVANGEISAVGNISTQANLQATGSITGLSFGLPTGDFSVNATGATNVTSLTAIGNITGANVTAGTITANTQIISNGGVSASGTITTTGTVNGGNISTNGTVIASGNITGVNITATNKTDIEALQTAVSNTPIPLTYASTFVLDMAIRAPQLMTLGGNITFNTPTNITPGAEISLIITGGAATHTIAFPAFKWMNGAPPSLPAGKELVIWLFSKSSTVGDVIASYTMQI